MTRKVRDALASATATLTPISDTPRLDAELLMAHALHIDRQTLLLSHLDGPYPPAFANLLHRRANNREPVAYITGIRQFWSLDLAIGPGVLIPRPDSETLVSAALAHFAAAPSPRSILDLGTGSAALLLAALVEWPDARGVGVDRSPEALRYARANAAVHSPGRARFVLADWAAPISATFDLILCNPPYVETDAPLAPEIAAHEPPAALFAGPDGLDAHRALAPQIARLLVPGGLACVEIGAGQASPAAALYAARGLAPTLRQDLAGRDRCLAFVH